MASPMAWALELDSLLVNTSFANYYLYDFKLWLLNYLASLTLSFSISKMGTMVATRDDMS